MIKHILFTVLITVILLPLSFGQTTQHFKVIDHESGDILIGATLQFPSLNLSGVSNQAGISSITKIPDGKHQLVIRYIGYEEKRQQIDFPTEQDTIVIALHSHMEEMEEVTISITRSGRTIERVPTRVEVIDGEELGEKAAMNSANIAMLLKESTGIQMQQTSAASGNRSIRIQGLDGRHTQLIRDGFPLFGGFSGGLSIMQIPPLDLQQVEVIKGSSSTLYGGGAIAGVVNLVTRTPEEKAKLELMIDQTTALKTTLNVFHSAQKGKFGWTLYTSGNFQKMYDVDNDNFSEIPETKAISINPSLFWNPSNKTKVRLTINTILEERLGGDVDAVAEFDNTDFYFEENQSKRFSYQLNVNHNLNSSSLLNVKNSISYYDRGILLPQYDFSGEQLASFSEVNYTKFKGKSEWVIGGNFYSDKFTEAPGVGTISTRNYSTYTLGAFSQYSRDISDKFALEAGLRVDYNNDYGTFVLPRISMLYTISDKLSSRFGGGFGYKTPTIFTEATEALNFRDIRPIDPSNLEAEVSRGLNWDLNYGTDLGGDWKLSFNQLFFITQLENSLLLRTNSTSDFSLENADGNVVSTGFETNIKLRYKDFKLFANYAFVNTELQYDNINQQKPLTPKHNIGAVLVFEQHEKWRIGYELYYTGIQNRSDFSRTSDFVEMGIMIMRSFENMSLYINFENFTDTRQSNYEPVAFGPRQTPQFREIWAPTEGRIINGGIILRW